MLTSGNLLARCPLASRRLFLRCPVKKIMLSLAGALLVFAAGHTIASTTIQSTPTQQESQQKAKIFSGTIIKNGDNFILNDSASKLAYVLDDAEKASEFVGKKVKVTGTVDVASNTIHVQTIQEIA
jgi:hypothetical protein